MSVEAAQLQIQKLASEGATLKLDAAAAKALQEQAASKAAETEVMI